MKRRQYHHGDLRATLVALALEEVDQSGPDHLSVAALAKQIGVSPMAPYRHFPDKQSLLEAVARHGFEQLAAAMRQVDDPDRPMEAVVAFGVCYVEFAAAHPGLFRLMYEGAPPTPDEGLSSDASTVLGLLTARIAGAAAPDSREDALLAGWCLMHGLASLCVSGRIRGAKAKPGELAARLGSLMTRAIAAKCEPRSGGTA